MATLKIVFSFLLIFIGLQIVTGQESLSLSDAIEKALANNYQIEISEKNIAVAQNNNTWKAAGRYPTVNLNLSNNNNFTGQNNPASFLQEFNSLSGGVTGSIDASYILFDGYRVKVNKKRFEALESQTKVNQQIAIENTIRSVMLAYYQALIQQENIETISELLAISRDRIAYQNARQEFGQAGKFDLLQIEDAYLNDSTTWLIQQNTFEIALRQLNLSMGEDELNRVYNLTDDLAYEGDSYVFEDLQNKMFSNNQNLQNLYVVQSLANIEKEASESAKYPSISLGTGANYTTSVSSLNIIKPSTFEVDNPNVQRNYNLYLNFSASYNLYNGGNTNRVIQNAILQEEIARLNIEDLKRNLSSQLNVTLANYNNQLALIELTKATVDNARENITIADERFKAGQINSFDYRTIQLNYLNATKSQLQAIFNLKNTELELLRLTGALVR